MLRVQYYDAYQRWISKLTENISYGSVTTTCSSRILSRARTMPFDIIRKDIIAAPKWYYTSWQTRTGIKTTIICFYLAVCLIKAQIAS